MKKLKIALIVSQSPAQFTLFQNISGILSDKYEVHLYQLPQMPEFLSALPARFFALLRRKLSPHPPVNNNSKKQVNFKTAAVSRACMCFKSVSAKVIAVPSRVIGRFYLFLLSFYIALKYDVVITHEIYWTGAISTLCAKFFRKKSISFIVGHSEEVYGMIKSKHKGISRILTLKLYTILEFITLRLADVIVSADYKDTEYLKGKRTKMVFEGKFATVDIQQFKYNDKIKEIYRKKLGIPNVDPVFLFVGWLTEHDGADIALNIYRTLSREKRNLWLIFIGSGILEEHIKKIITEENLQKVILTGYIPHNEIHNYMIAGDIGLMPLREPQCGPGFTVLELLAVEIPLIATDVDSLREVIIDYKTGFIVKEDIVGEAVQKINFLLESPDILGKMRINARKMVEQDFSQESISARVFSLIDTCMDS